MSTMTAVGTRTEELTHGEILTIVVGIVLAMFLGALDQTIIAAALPTIARQFSDFENVSWVASIYFLTSTAVTPLYGKFSDIHGRRITLLLGIVTFVAGSIACAIAPSMLLLVAARAVQGLGGGGLISLAQTIVADVVAPKDRGRYQIIFASVFLAASLLGPTLGGFLTEHFHWSFIFWINVPLGAGAYIMTSSSLKRLPRHDRPHELDVLGAVLMVVATVSIMLALSTGGHRYSWLSTEIVGLGAVSLSFWLLFAWRIASAHEPLIPIDILSNRVVLSGTGSAFFGMGTYMGLTIHMPVYFETVRGLSVAQSGLALIPLMVGTVVGATLAGQTMGRIIHYKRLPAVGLLVATLGTIALGFRGHTWSMWAVEGDLSVISIGLGALFPTTTVAIQNAVAPQRMGTATGTMNFFRQLGSALFIAIFGAILLNGGAVDIGDGFNRQLAITAYFPLFMTAAGGFAAAFVCMALMKELPLRARVPSAAPPAAD